MEGDNEDTSSLVESMQDFFSKEYDEKIREAVLHYPAKKSVFVDYIKLDSQESEIADLLARKPDEVVAASEEAIRGMNISVPGHGIFSPHVRFVNVPDQNQLIESISSKSIGELISVKGVVSRRADVMYRLQIAVYKCQVCDSIYKIPVERDHVHPKRCEACKKIALKHMEEQSKFIDLQKAEIQDLLEKVKGGTPASRVELWMEDDIVNSIVPGDNIHVVGILRLKPPNAQKGNKNEMIYGRYLDVNSVWNTRRDIEELDLSKDDVRRIVEFSQMPNLKDKIIKSVAPTIYGHNEVKHAVALQLFGGTRGKVDRNMPIRDDIHILLIGDPGIAKTRFLQSAGLIAPKFIYNSGKSVSGVGLTVAVEKDELSGGGWTLKAGALVLASGGMAAIDEFDKIEDDDRAALHEVMESQTVSVAKAGIVAKFRAKTAIIAAANPKFGRFNRKANPIEQIDLPPSLISRFDLLFPLLDEPDPVYDEKLATAILSSHERASRSIGKTEDTGEFMDRDFLRKYIAYARTHIYPTLSTQATDRIKAFYVDMRKMGKETETVPITPRYLEALIRLSEANAKMRLSKVVEEFDADEAINLFKFVLDRTMKDEATGKIDVTILSTGKTRTKINYDVVLDVVKEICTRYDVAEEQAIFAGAAKHGLEPGKVAEILQELVSKGRLYTPTAGNYKTAY
jgi:replicative DNA helicase Mcm